jgi:hypothetical protein
MQKETLKNSLRNRCDSCGEMASCKKYNLAYLCVTCLRMDPAGKPRDSRGKIFSNESVTLIIPDEEKPYRNRKRKR